MQVCISPCCSPGALQKHENFNRTGQELGAGGVYSIHLPFPAVRMPGVAGWDAHMLGFASRPAALEEGDGPGEWQAERHAHKHHGCARPRLVERLHVAVTPRRMQLVNCTARQDPDHHGAEKMCTGPSPAARSHHLCARPQTCSLPRLRNLRTIRLIELQLVEIHREQSALTCH